MTTDTPQRPTSPSDGFVFDPTDFPPPRPERGRPTSPKRATVVQLVARAASRREPITSTQLYAEMISMGISPGAARNAYTGCMRPAAYNPVRKATAESALVLDGFHLAALPTVEHRIIKALAALPAHERAPILQGLAQTLGVAFDPAEVEDVVSTPAPSSKRPRRSPRQPRVIFQGE